MIKVTMRKWRIHLSRSHGCEEQIKKRESEEEEKKNGVREWRREDRVFIGGESGRLSMYAVCLVFGGTQLYYIFKIYIYILK